MQGNKEPIQLSFPKAISILAGAVLTTFVATVFVVAGVANNDHFTLISVRDLATKLEQTKVDAQVYQADQRTDDQRFTAIQTQLNAISSTQGQILTLITNLSKEKKE